MAEKNYFEVLNAIDVSDKTEKKNNLTYLSWAWAWGELKKKHPDATYKVYENKDEWNYFTDGRTAWVKVSVTANGVEHVEMLPVMDFRNKSIQLNAITSFEVNKAIQRALTKAIARHGLGLYIYAGEDLPEESDGKQKTEYKCCDCGSPFHDFTDSTGKYYSVADIAAIAMSKNPDGKARCSKCMKK